MRTGVNGISTRGDADDEQPDKKKGCLFRERCVTERDSNEREGDSFVDTLGTATAKDASGSVGRLLMFVHQVGNAHGGGDSCNWNLFFQGESTGQPRPAVSGQGAEP